MAVSFKNARLMAEELTTIPDCPRSEAALDAIAKDLFRLCKNDDEAQELVATARDQWISWRGTIGLIEILQGMRRGPESVPLERRTIDLGPKPHVNCAACQDWGYIWRAGRNEYCTCAEGVRMQTEAAGLLETFNRKNIKGPQALQAAVVRRPVSESDLEQAFLESKKHKDATIARQKAVLEDEAASKEEKEIARETLRLLGEEA